MKCFIVELSLSLLLLQFLSLIESAHAAGGNWTKPNGLAPSFTDTYTVGERIFVSWMSLNNSVNDLWLTRYDTKTDRFALRLQVARNVSYADSYEWTIAVDATEVAKDTRFILQFLPTGTAYDPQHIPFLPSPAFNLITLNQQTLPNGTVGAPSITPSSTSAAASNTASLASDSSANSTSASIPPPPNNNGPGFNRSIAIGVATGVGVLFVITVIGGFFVIRMYRKRPRSAPRESTVIPDEEFKALGPYEVLGTSRQPTELSSKETVVSELSCAKEMMVYEKEAPESPIYEMSTTVKRPGMHELPG